MGKVTKADLVEALSDMGYVKSQLGKVIDDIFKVITDRLLDGDTVSIRGFGTFATKERKGRLGTDPKTHEQIMRPPYRALVFYPGYNLKKSVKNVQETLDIQPECDIIDM